MNPEVFLKLTTLLTLVIGLGLFWGQLMYTLGSHVTLSIAKECSMEEWHVLHRSIAMGWLYAFFSFMLTIPHFFKWYLA